MMQRRQGVDGLEFRRTTRFISGYVVFVATVGLVRLWGDLFYERLMLFFIPPVSVLILWQVQKKPRQRVLRYYSLFSYCFLCLAFFLVHRTQ